jgi:tripartite-type tricarboxylate transporter receptor subunit TctC
MKKLCAMSFAATLLIAGAVQAQTYPSKVVRIILGFPAGTTVDLLVRPVAQKLSESMGQQFIVENRAGRAGRLHAARSEVGNGHAGERGQRHAAPNP